MAAELRVLAPREGRTVAGILETAASTGMVECIILGTDADGELVFLNSGVSIRDALWLIEAGRDDVMGK